MNVRLEKFGKAVKIATAALICGAISLGEFRSRADELQQVWALAPGSRPYLTTDNSQRGVAYNSKTRHVLMVNRSGGLSIVIFNAANGDEIGFLDTTGITGGTFALSMIGVAEDGAIYGANLATATQSLKIYRWKDEQSAPTIAFNGDPANGVSPQRWGDSMDVRGSGKDTQILLGSNAGTTAALLTTKDGELFDPFIVSNAASAGSLGVAFGRGNSFWTKKNAQGLWQIGFTPGAVSTGNILAGANLARFTTAQFPSAIAPITINSSNILVGLAIETPDNVRAYDLADVPPTLIDQKVLPTDNANANVAGSADAFNELVFVLDTNNGLLAYRLVSSVVAPRFTTQPVGATILEGATVTLSANSVGTKPISYQWFLGTEAVKGATNTTLVISNINPGLGGSYTLKASNAAGTATSDAAAINVIASVRTEVLTKIWTLPTGSRPYITDGNTERGIAYNPLTKRVLVVTRTSGVRVYVLNAETGVELYQLNTEPSVVFGSEPDGFRLNLIRVADDGAVYAANLSTSGTRFALYRWADDGPNTVPTLAWSGDPGLGQRWGDTMDVRGSGVNTQILLGSRNGTAVSILTTFDGVNFAPTVFDVPGATAGSFGLGVAFGKGDTFWGKSNGANFPLRHVQFDLFTGQASILQTFDSRAFPAAITAIDVDVETSSLYGIGVETPDNLRIFNVANLDAPPILRDTEFFPSDLENLNGTAAIDVKGDRAFALDSNNGIIALNVNRPLIRAPRLVPNGRPANGVFTITFLGIPGDTYTVSTSTDLKTWTDIFIVGADSTGVITIGDNNAGNFPYRFYRATVK